MQNQLVRFRPLLEPLGGTVFLVMWIAAEAGRLPWVPGNRGHVVGWLAVTACIALAIALSRLTPVAALAFSGAALIAQMLGWLPRFGSTDWPVYLGILVVLFGVGAYGTGLIRRASPWIVSAFAIAATVLLAAPIFGAPFAIHVGFDWQYVAMRAVSAFGVALALAFTPWFLGLGYRAWLLQRVGSVLLEKTEDELHTAELDLLVSTERDRIAQDVHDIMAHSLSVIIAQADGARFVNASRPEAVESALEQIARSARTSLTEVRMLIESLVADPVGHSQPTIQELDDLIERMRTAGLTITIDRFGEAATLTSTQQLAVYRIIQEGLTNALKHAGNNVSVRVVLDWRGPGLAMTVLSEGLPAESPALETNASPRGLYGMRERARLAGGWLTAGEVEDLPGGYLITVFIPSAPHSDDKYPSSAAAA